MYFKFLTLGILLGTTSLTAALTHEMSLWEKLVEKTATSYLTADNFHEVVPGKVYRMSQVCKSNKHLLEHYGIKTIVNLRGTNEDKLWWQEERQVAGDLGISVIDIEFNHNEFPTVEALQSLFAVFDDVDNFPLAIHCRKGLNRTGLACALYLCDYQHASAATAKWQLSFVRFGHIYYFHPVCKRFIDWWGNLHCAGNTRDQILEAYAPARDLLNEGLAWPNWIYRRPQPRPHQN